MGARRRPPRLLPAKHRPVGVRLSTRVLRALDQLLADPTNEGRWVNRSHAAEAALWDWLQREGRELARLRLVAQLNANQPGLFEQEVAREAPF